jgi:GAG-pre-integrase domain
MQHAPQISSGSDPNKSTISAQVAYQEGTGNGSGKTDTTWKNYNEWILDKGATDHMTFNKNDLINFKRPRKNGIVNANGICYPVSTAGDVYLHPNVTLQNTLVVPSLSSKLVSVGQLTKELNCMVNIFPDHCVFQDIQTRKVLGGGTRRDGLYYLDGLKTGEALLSIDLKEREIEILLWHKRLGHLSLGYMKKLCPQLFNNYNCETIFCEIYLKAKSHRSTYLPSNNKTLAPFDLIHTYVWGPSPIMFKVGYRCYIKFVDDFS